tara:strand:- start:4991 stop:6379 length:1389 start_codon:yes stop_codon:yes gene_type:complete
MNNFLNISLIYGFGFFLLRSLSFLLLPIYTNLLTASDAGIIFIVYTILAFLNPIYALGMDSSLLKFYNSNKYSKSQVTSSSLGVAILVAFIFSLSLILISQHLSFLLNLTFNSLFFIAIILFFDSLSARLLVVLRLLEQPFYYLGIGIINIAGSLVLNVLFLKFYLLGSLGAVYALVWVSLLQFLCLLPALIKNFNLSYINYELIKKMFLFGLPFLPASILFIITGMSDRWLIKLYLDLHQVGLYGAGYKVGSAISIVVLAFNLSWQPYYLKNSTNNDFIKNIHKISYVFFIILFFFTISLSIFWPLLINIRVNGYYIIGSVFWDGGTIIPWVALGYFFYGMFVLQSPSIYIKNKQIWAPFFWLLGASSNVLLNVLLIPPLGIVGAAISSFVSYFCMFVFVFYKNQKWLQNNFIDSFLVLLFCWGGAVVMVNQYFLYPFLSYILYSLFSFASFLKLYKAFIK